MCKYPHMLNKMEWTTKLYGCLSFEYTIGLLVIRGNIESLVKMESNRDVMYGWGGDVRRALHTRYWFDFHFLYMALDWDQLKVNPQIRLFEETLDEKSYPKD